MIENKSYTLGELKLILDKLNLPVEVSLFRKANFNNTNPKIFLIQSDKNEYIGHFCLLYFKDDTAYFFDPSGTRPLQIFKDYHLDQNLQDISSFYDCLTNYTIDYNDHNYQTKNSKLCGIMCIVRYYFNDMETDAFYNYIQSIKKQYGFKSMDDTFINILNTLLGN